MDTRPRLPQTRQSTVQRARSFQLVITENLLQFRYQLTVIGAFAQAIVAEKIKGNQFKIATSLPNVEVSWQVTGVRQDAWANKHRIPNEELKSEAERGHFLHPDLYGQSEEKGMDWARDPQGMRNLKERIHENAKPNTTPAKPANQ